MPSRLLGPMAVAPGQHIREAPCSKLPHQRWRRWRLQERLWVESGKQHPPHLREAAHPVLQSLRAATLRVSLGEPRGGKRVRISTGGESPDQLESASLALNAHY